MCFRQDHGNKVSLTGCFHESQSHQSTFSNGSVTKKPVTIDTEDIPSRVRVTAIATVHNPTPSGIEQCRRSQNKKEGAIVMFQL